MNPFNNSINPYNPLQDAGYNNYNNAYNNNSSNTATFDQYQQQYEAMLTQQARNQFIVNVGLKTQNAAQERVLNEERIARLQEHSKTLPLSGPTPNELKQFPALNIAWEEYLLIKTLTLGSKS
jgi:hypothetical protein